ncbi:Uncharacterized protein DBV15_02316 [Temnothorax longispinosus]|uniref:Uncharacterized protein n=1 Tax=Temnothorax longispinosus TaxID=300112 RepID=A0A4S2LAH2_9HYME|nr:Uncharacterized protein DBV15_02316 [Temnothorax longispinosus]
MRPNLAPRLLSSRLVPPHNPPRVPGYTASARTLARPSLPGPSALETRKCVHRIQNIYHHQQQVQHYQRQRHRHHPHYYPRNLSYNYNYDYEEDEEYDDRFQRCTRLPLRSTPGTLTFVNLLVKRFLCFLTCSPCGLRSAA